MRTEFSVPGEVIIDPESGYAVNMPLGPQSYPGWQKDFPKVVERIKAIRKEQGIAVGDDRFTDRLKSRSAMQPRTEARAAAKPKKRRK